MEILSVLLVNMLVGSALSKETVAALCVVAWFAGGGGVTGGAYFIWLIPACCKLFSIVSSGK